MLTVYTFGDSILDCGHYNEHGINPAQLLVRNEDRFFPEFRGQDLSRCRVGEVRLEHLAIDGSTVEDLPLQASRIKPAGPSIALLTIGGNDLISGLLDDGSKIADFVIDLHAFLRDLPIRPVLIGTVYDPTFGDDSVISTRVEPATARKHFAKVNSHLVALGNQVGAAVDLHAHFLAGRPDWFTRTIEPSLKGASEVRRCFWEAIRKGGWA